MTRVYLDHNATTLLRPQARAAMVAAMDVMGNPSSVHAEGRAALGVLARARQQVSDAIGAEGCDIVFTSGATEAAGLGLAGRGLEGAAIEHDAVRAWHRQVLAVDADGRVSLDAPDLCTLQMANSETGVLQDVPQGIALTDMTQAFGKLPLDFNATGACMALVSAHKLGGPKGVGALILRRGQDVPVQIKGGGQELGRRSGTENLIGIAGFGAAAEAAARDVHSGAWDKIAQLRKILENGIAATSNKTIFVGKGSDRLPNTSCMITPGWKGETQVMQMDLAGFAISAGSACSSGKVTASTVLRAMGYDDATSSCAIRVSLGLDTTEQDITRFIDTWAAKYEKHLARAA